MDPISDYKILVGWQGLFPAVQALFPHHALCNMLRSPLQLCSQVCSKRRTRRMSVTEGVRGFIRLQQLQQCVFSLTVP